MTDLHQMLPDFDVKPYSHLIHSLVKNDITVADLVSLEPTEIARKCPLPLLDVRRLVSAVIHTLQRELDMIPIKQSTSRDLLAGTSQPNAGRTAHAANGPPAAMFIQTLDQDIDEFLGGGFPCGYVTEVVGESAAGKTQFLISLLLAVQLGPPRGVGKAAIHISTEDPLNTARLQQILDTHPHYTQLSDDQQPSFNHVHSMVVSTLEHQQYVIENILPGAVEKYNAGLVVVDSVAANFRADRETTTSNSLIDRAADLNKLGSILRKLAVEKRVAVVVANQVSDRFVDSLMLPTQDLMRSSSPGSSTATPSQSNNRRAERDVKLTLDHQSRFFTGWGDKPAPMPQGLKTPALGLAWANQIDGRIVLKVESDASPDASNRKRRRFMNVVFAPWTDQNLNPLEYSIEAQGIVATVENASTNEHSELLDESLWADDGDEEFP